MRAAHALYYTDGIKHNNNESKQSPKSYICTYIETSFAFIKYLLSNQALQIVVMSEFLAGTLFIWHESLVNIPI